MIRKGDTSDLAGLVDIEIEAFGVPGIVVPQEMPRMRAEWENALQRDSVYCIEADGQTVGALHVIEGEDHDEIKTLIVSGSYQGAGLGSQLLAPILKSSDESGKPLSLEVSPDNKGAIRFYERHGFHVSKTLANSLQEMSREPQMAREFAL